MVSHEWMNSMQPCQLKNPAAAWAAVDKITGRNQTVIFPWFELFEQQFELSGASMDVTDDKRSATNGGENLNA